MGTTPEDVKFSRDPNVCIPNRDERHRRLIIAAGRKELLTASLLLAAGKVKYPVTIG
jgi:hypothetical protein